VLDGFGRAQLAASRWVMPRSLDELTEVFRRAREERLSLVFRGSGRSYGDASLNTGGLAVDLRGMDRMLAWDPQNGIADLEPGVTIEGLWRRTIQDGFWPAVVPGTMFPTMGGCVAMNIHGKNCFRVGPFGDQVQELDLLTPAGEVRTLSRTQEPVLFKAVIAGLGLLGAVTRVRLKLKKVDSGLLRVKPIVSRSLGEMFDQFEEHLPDADYLVGWVDCFAGGARLGRGLVHRADYLHAGEDANPFDSLKIERQVLPGHIFGVPRSIMWRFMKPITNDFGMRMINAAKFYMPEPASGPDHSFLQPHVAFAFLLDYVPNWRLAYGEHGFIQYQVFLPDTTARQVMPELLELCRNRGLVSYLGVFKRHRPDEYLLSHGLDGWSMALDFPTPPGRRERLMELTREMTARVLDAGGRFYPAKDSVLNAGEFARCFGDRLTRFLELKRRLDPGNLILGDQGRRLMPALVDGARS
jgi:FAD/FMN-containing dehydrogenase